MEIWHRVGFNAEKRDFHRALDEMRVKYKVLPSPGIPVSMIFFDMAESDPCWPKVDELIRAIGASNMFDTVFTLAEIREAEWSRLAVVFEQGLPQPKEGWDELTLENKCNMCGAGYQQRAPFRIEKEPRLGKNDFMGLYWTWTAFCAEKVVSALKDADMRGYKVCVPVIHRTGEPSTVISQLSFPTIAGPALAEEDGQRPETCAQCGITKYGYHKKGYMRLKRDALPQGVDFLQTWEWFGSGGHAGFRETLVSNRVARLVAKSHWRGVRLKPVELV